MTEEELFRFLQWMLAHGILDHNESNQILLKSLPFVE